MMKSTGRSRAFRDFFSSDTASGFVLFGCVIISLIIANSPLGSRFNDVLRSEVGWATSIFHLRYSILSWTNDGLMAVFFLLIGLEIKREFVQGELSTAKNAALPVMCAVGGAALPGLIYHLINSGEPTAKGWGIPMATDIAFAIALVSLLGKKVPASLKIFLTALAIADDLIAILVIAVFYSSALQANYLLYACAAFLLLILFNRLRVKPLFFYLAPGLAMWYFIHQSGIHATVAGVLTAAAIPLDTKEMRSPLHKLEHLLVNPVNFFILPLFALFNSNIRFEKPMIDAICSPMGMGIILGLMIGKPVGILAVSWMSVRSGIAALPQDVQWKQMFGIGLMAGVGFTMSVFIALLSLPDPQLTAGAKLSILVGSVASGFAGYLVLKSANKKRAAT